MSLSHTQMQRLLTEIKPRIEGAICQAAGINAPDTLVLQFQDSSAKLFRLLVCLGPALQRFHLTEKALPPPTHTPFFKILMKTVIGKKAAKCSLLNDDRILAIQFSDNTQLISELLPRRSNCYLLDSTSHILTSWHPSKNTTYHLPEKPVRTYDNSKDDNDINSFSIENDYFKRELEAEFLQQKQSVLKQLQSFAKRAEKNVQQRQLTLSQCQQWQEWHHQGVMLQSQLFRLHKGMTEVIVDDWDKEGTPQTITLDPLLEPYLQAEALFKRCRKLRLGIPHAERLLQQAQQDSIHRQKQLSILKEIASLVDLQAFCHQNKLSTGTSHQAKTVQYKKTQPAKPYHAYALTNGLHAWVGKSAKDNDKLSFQHANGSDWWLHIRDYPGSHVVVRCNKNQILDGEDLKDAAELAMRFSKAKNIKAGEVALTQAKYLTRVKGVPGKVQLSKHKVVHHTLDEKRWQRLKTSKQVQ